MTIYTFFVALAAIYGFSYVSISLGMKGIPKYIIAGLLAISILLIPTGARLYSLVVSQSKGVNIFNAGWSSLGGVAGVILSVLLISLVDREHHRDYAESFAVAVPVMYGVAKLGCYFVGCCYSDIIPVQLFESITFILLFFVSVYLRHRESVNIVAFELVVCGLIKFGYDFFRHSHKGRIISINQWGCVSLIWAGFGILLYEEFKKRKIVKYER